MSKLLVIDTETGGLDPATHSILSVGAIIWEDGKLMDSFEVYVLEPTLQVDKKAMEVNRISLPWLHQHGLNPADAVKQFIAFIERNFNEYQNQRDKVPIVGHNINFDVGFLKRLFSLAGQNYDEVFSHRVLDTAGILRFLSLAGKISIHGAGSTAAFDYFHIDINSSERHTALADARATGQLLTKLIELVKPDS